MSILEKLKDLVKALEVEDTETESAEIVDNLNQSEIDPGPPSTELPPPAEPEPSVTEVVEEFPDYLECTLEETAAISEKLAELQVIKLNIGELVSSFEDRKQKMLSKLTSSRKQLLAQIESLRLEYGVPQEGYQVKLPSSPEDKVSFSKKE